MKYAIISGSSRAKSQSSKISHYIQNELKAYGETFLFELAGNPLPLWDESIWSGDPTWQKAWTPIQTELQAADAFVFVVPEWGGMVPPAVKNFFLLCSHQELGHKPGLIVTVSSSRNGAYPVSELRMSSYKNNRLCYIPEHLIVREAEKVLNPGEALSEDDRYLRQRTTYCLKLLDQYAKALLLVRKSGIIDHKSFPNGL